MANICFGCNEVENVEKCPKKNCAHYGFRNEHLSMDDEANQKRTNLIKRTSRNIMMYSTKYVSYV